MSQVIPNKSRSESEAADASLQRDAARDGRSRKKEPEVDNDKAFGLYALALVTGIASVITASLMAGYATLPTAGVFIEHVALSLTFRAAYKSFGGFEWAYQAAEFAGVITADAAEAATGGGAEAVS
jgi:hypothetical protein